MTQAEIKTESERCYAIIRDAENGLKILRERCKHPNTFHGDYQYRVGATFRAEICTDCGTVVKHL
jgi:hypothetical protein